MSVVTRASRGVGRGIALVLGECGATVYATGRSVRGGPITVGRYEGQPVQHIETIDETAELVTARGGVGIAVRCDHTIDEQVDALFRRVHREQGRLDVLVNNVWGGYENMDEFGAPFWEQPLWRWDAMFTAGVRALRREPARRAADAAATTGAHREHVRGVAGRADDGRLIYYLAKLAINRMAWGMGESLRWHGITTVSVSPVGRRGWVASGGELRSIHDAVLTPGGTESLFRANPRLRSAQTPEYTGRAVAMLAADPEVLKKTGRVLKVSDLAEEYGFTDIDGRRPPHD